MNNNVKLQLMLGITGPIAGIVGFGFGYGLGKIVYGIWNKLDDYCYYKKKGI